MEFLDEHLEEQLRNISTTITEQPGRLYTVNMHFHWLIWIAKLRWQIWTSFCTSKVFDFTQIFGRQSKKYSYKTICIKSSIFTYSEFITHGWIHLKWKWMLIWPVLQSIFNLAIHILVVDRIPIIFDRNHTICRFWYLNYFFSQPFFKEYLQTQFYLLNYLMNGTHCVFASTTTLFFLAQKILPLINESTSNCSSADLFISSSVLAKSFCLGMYFLLLCLKRN